MILVLLLTQVLLTCYGNLKPYICNGGWTTYPDDVLVSPGPCNIQIRDSTLSQDEFLKTYAYTEPFIIRDGANNDLFRALTGKEELLSRYGEYIVRLSSANSYSYDKKDMTFTEYCDKHLYPQNKYTLGNETFYMFGDNDNVEWGDLLNEYNIPSYNLPRHSPALSFGVAGPGSGVPFHFHGPGFAEAIHGRKRWFLTKPDEKPVFHPNKTTLQWYLEDYPTIRKEMNLYECTIRPGEAIYFPDKWWHATLNLDTSLRLRKVREQIPYETIYTHINNLIETNIDLVNQNQNLESNNAALKQEKIQLEAALQVRAGAFHAADSINVQELQQKLIGLQEELTEMHRRKGENAQQVIDLTAAVKILEKEISEKQIRIENLEAQIMVLKQDMKAAESQISELESTNQLLKDEYQALQLALNSAELSLSSVKSENDLLITQLMALKAKDAERMNLENDMFMQHKHRTMQQELAEAASEARDIGDVGNDIHNPSLPSLAGFEMPTKSIAKFECHEGEVNCVQWDYFGKYLCTAGSDRKIKVWEVDQFRTDCRATLVGSNAAVVGVDFDQNSTMVLGSCNDFATRVWTIDDCRLRHTLTGHSGKVMSAKFFSDATRIVSGSHDRTLKLWDLRGKSCISTKFAGSSCNDVVTNDSSVISGHFDKKVRFWDVRTSSNEPSNELCFGGKVTSLDLTRDRTMLAVCARDDKISIIDLRSMSVARSLQADGFHVGCDWSRVAFSVDGQYIASGSMDGSVYVWNVLTGELEHTLNGHSVSVYAVSWHPGGLYLASVDKQKSCIIWSS